MSGASGAGKTIFAGHFVDAACKRGERALFFSFEESQDQIIRNMASVGIDLRQHINSGLLRIESARPSLFGLEMHLVLMIREVEAFKPAVVAIDPISAFRGSAVEIHATLLRMVDLLKQRGITTMFTELNSGTRRQSADQAMSSLMDSWIDLHDIEGNGERNRGLYLIKARGMSHSNQVREYILTDDGVALIDPYIGPEGVLTGSARITQSAQEEARTVRRAQEAEKRRRDLEAKRAALERQIVDMRASLAAEERELSAEMEEARVRDQALKDDKTEQAARRGAAE